MAGPSKQRRQRKIEEVQKQLDELDRAESGNQTDAIDTAQKVTAIQRPKRGRGGTENFPNSVKDENADDVRRVLNDILFWYKLPEAKSDQDIAERTEMFFDICAQKGERPTVEKYCLALGYAYTTVSEWKNGLHCSAARSYIIKKAFAILASYDAGMATEGKMNPVPYIFRAKNYYGMKDQTDLVVTPNNPLGDTISAEEIEQRYAELPEE